AVGARAARRAARVAPVPAQRAALAEIVSAPRHDGRLVGPAADDAREAYRLEQRGLRLVLLLVRVGVPHALARGFPLRAGHHRAGQHLLALGHLLPLAIELPPVGVVLARVQELAPVAEAAEARLLPVLAHV